MHDGQRSAWCASVVLAALSSCAGPALRIDTVEPDAELYLDGRRVGHGAAELPFRFYGASAVTVVPARRSTIEPVRAPVRTLVRCQPPAPEWLFPFDFFIEAVSTGFASPPPLDVTVDLPSPAATLPHGTLPRGAEELRQRALMVQQER